MKIRRGFISNSSSSSFVVAVTRSFSPTELGIKTFMAEYNEMFDTPVFINDASSIISYIVNYLCINEYVEYRQERDDRIRIGFDVFINVFSDLCLTTIDAAPDQGVCVNIFADSLINKTTDSVRTMLGLNI